MCDIKHSPDTLRTDTFSYGKEPAFSDPAFERIITHTSETGLSATKLLQEEVLAKQEK